MRNQHHNLKTALLKAEQVKVKAEQDQLKTHVEKKPRQRGFS